MEAVRVGFQMILSGVGLDWQNDPHLADTPRRAAKAWVEELCAGITKPPPKITTFKHGQDTGMILLEEVPVKSMCAHHLLPFVGTAQVAYIGFENIIGLSKLSRVVDHISRRPQVQENLTAQVADYIYDLLGGEGGMILSKGSVGVGVVVRATHMCMSLRGVNHPGLMVTSALRGVFTVSDVRAEFFSLTQGGSKR